MDWDTYSIEKVKNPQKTHRTSEIAIQKARCNGLVLPRGITTSSNPIEEYARIGVSSWRMPYPIEAYPHILSDKSIATELDEVKRQNESMLRVVSSLQSKIEFFQSQILEMQKEIKSLKLQTISKNESDNIWEINKIEIARMEKMFNLPPPSGEPIEQQIRKMRGYLKEYSEDGLDIVDLIHAMRDHE